MFIILILCFPFSGQSKTVESQDINFSKILTYNFNYIKSKIIYIKNKSTQYKQNNINISNNENIKVNKSNKLNLFRYENKKIQYEFTLRESFSTSKKISFISFVDNEGREYFYNRSRGKFEINFKCKEVALLKDKNNNLSLTFGDNYSITRNMCGKIILSDNLLYELFNNENFRIRQIVFETISDNFPETEYAKLIPIFRNNIDFEKYITQAINYYRDIISEKPLGTTDNLSGYTENRVKYFVENKIIPSENPEYESPYLEGYSGISSEDRKRYYGIEREISEINKFYVDPINFVVSLFEDLSYRAEFLSLNAVNIGVSHSKKHKLVSIAVSHNDSTESISSFRIYPPHRSKNIKPSIMYPSGSLRAYPISIHTDGAYEPDKPLSLTEKRTNEALNFTKGKFYGTNARYIIGKKAFEHGQTYSVEFGFTELYIPVKSIKCSFEIMKMNEYDKYDIVTQLYE